METHRFAMEDGQVVTTQIISNITDGMLDCFLQNICRDSDLIVGFDTEWSFTNSDGSIVTEVVLLKLCNQDSCLLIKLKKYQRYSFGILSKLLVNRDIVFAGVDMQRDLEKLREASGLEIRNAVDLSELAANVVERPQPHRTAYSIRWLAGELLLQPLNPKPSTVLAADWNWNKTDLNYDQIEHATIDAYFTYKIAKKLLSKN